MTEFTKEQKNEVLDEIIMARRSIRNFTPDVPPTEMVRQVIVAGLHAPYTRAAVETYKDGYFRRFFVAESGTESMNRLSSFLLDRVREMASDIEEKIKGNPELEEKNRSWIKRLRWFLNEGHVPGVTNAPYYIIIAERRGIPDIGQHALAHCLENMWLKATALGLAFQITSVASEMGSDPRFCAHLGLIPGEWDIMGCALGYGKQQPGPSKRPSADEVTTWLP